MGMAKESKEQGWAASPSNMSQNRERKTGGNQKKTDLEGNWRSTAKRKHHQEKERRKGPFGAQGKIPKDRQDERKGAIEPYKN